MRLFIGIAITLIVTNVLWEFFIKSIYSPATANQLEKLVRRHYTKLLRVISSFAFISAYQLIFLFRVISKNEYNVKYVTIG